MYIFHFFAVEPKPISRVIKIDRHLPVHYSTEVPHTGSAAIKPSLLLEGETPRLLDEWQIAPIIWDAVRFTVDQREKTGQFILTGSAVPADNVTAHTGTGRISRLRMRPMSLFESQDSAGSVSMKTIMLP